MCCGRDRGNATQARVVTDPGPRRAMQPEPSVLFEYVGPTGLSVRGAVTGQGYRFDRGGSRVAVDLRDAPSLLALPQLRRIGR
jgi:hypothetical protein